MTFAPVRYIGTFPKGSRIPSLEHQFLDDNGDPYDLSTGVWNAQGRAEQLHVEQQPTGVGDGNCTVNTVDAKAIYSWADADFGTIGRFRIILWIGNGTQRFGSTIYEWEVYDGPGADPTV